MEHFLHNLLLVMCFCVFTRAVEREEFHYTTIDLILKNGYPAEVHSVTTTDGYILEMHRIPYSPMAASATNKPAVFLLHGLTSSSYDWISMGPGRSLGYLLADAGYDVWMGNNRGNRYSRKHTTLSPRNKKFWDFSWHEMGIYDAPAQIDYILNSTKLQSVYYVGMSMGNTIFFVLASEKPQYNDKIKLGIALAPVVYMGNTRSPVANNAYNEITLEIFQLLGMEEVASSGSLINVIGSRICGQKIAKAVCENLIFAGSGYDPKQLDSSMLPMVFSHFPTGASLKTFRHYNQIVHSGKFRKFDYGRRNTLKYNQTIPPEYNLSSITAPVGLFYADNDGFSHPKDVLQLRRVLRNVVEVYRVPWPTFGHFGYVFAKDVKTLVNDEVMKLIREHIDLILKNGYPAEAHSVTTADGYILEMHRIPYSPLAASATNKPAVFLLHGLTSSSFDWISMGPGRSLGYLLADAGYDVWMGNNRGNRYSRKHITLSTRNKKFWDFSWHEMGIYDTPAQIDYILNATKLESIYYVGTSMGNTIFFVFASEKPEYNEKIKLSIAMAPIVYMGNITSPLARNAFNAVILRIFQLLGLEELVPSGSFINVIGSSVCGQKIAKAVCENIIFAGSGYDPKQLDSSMFPMMLSHYPAGSSLKSFRHYQQIVQSGKFRKFDYGKGNMKKYNQTSPPEYNLSAMTVPVALFYADNDAFSHPDDVFRLRRVLKNVVEVYRVPWPTFGHFGYVYAKDVKTLVNDEVMKLIREY